MSNASSRFQPSRTHRGQVKDLLAGMAGTGCLALLGWQLSRRRKVAIARVALGLLASRVWVEGEIEDRGNETQSAQAEQALHAAGYVDVQSTGATLSAIADRN